MGELLSHNTFAYCNNNPVTSKDTNWFRPVYTQGEETAAMREALHKVMNNYNSSFNYIKSLFQELASGAIDEGSGRVANLFIKGKTA